MKRTRINPISQTRRSRSGKPGKLGTVRLYGDDLEALREEAFIRSGGHCEMERDGERCNYRITRTNSEMAHVRNKRMYGDTPDNILMSCKNRIDGQPGCHTLSHNAGGKPCPSKRNL